MRGWRHRAAFAMVIALCFMHGLFASGFVPIIHRYVPSHAALAFGLYFAGLLFGQLLIYRFARLRRGWLALPAYEALFGASLILMAVGFGFLPYNITGGRLLEGVAAGLGIPMLFACVVHLRALRSAGLQIALFQSVFAIGFVAGPPAIEWLSHHLATGAILALFGSAFIACGFSFTAVLRGAPEPEPPADPSLATAGSSWFDTFYTLFLAKSFYGFSLPFAAAHLAARAYPLTIAQLMLVLSAAFIVGQVLANPISKLVPRGHLEVNLPLLLAVALLVYGATGVPWLFLPAATLQAMILFVGLLGLASKPSSAKEFAFFGCLSDPGMLIGAAIAGLGERGVFVMAALCVIPIARLLGRSPAFTRAERILPFVGPTTLVKLLRKQARPVEAPVDRDLDRASVAARIGFAHEAAPASEAQPVEIVFAGDLAPTPELVDLAPEVVAFLEEHDLRIVNLEAPQTSARHDALNRFACFDLPDAQLARIAPPFNVVSIANNHSMDRGVSKFERTFARLRDGRVATPVDGELVELEIRGVRLGLVACTFGTNLFWRRHRRLRVVKPEEVVGGTTRGRALLDDLRRHRARVDALILSYHWGYESEYWPSSLQLECWQMLRDAGVDILFGHHSHIVQPFEVSPDGRALCLYSCGNFISPMPLAVYRQGALFSVTLRPAPGGCRIERVVTRFTQREANRVRFIEPDAALVHAHWARQR